MLEITETNGESESKTLHYMNITTESKEAKIY